MTSRERILEYMRKDAYRPMTEGELLAAFAIKKGEIRRFKRLLREMEQEGLIYQTRAARFGLPEKMNLRVGNLQGHPRGYGFVLSERPENKDVYVSASNMHGAMHGDRVVIRLIPGRNGKKEGEVVKILRRANREIVGTFQKQRHYGFVIPDEERIGYDVFVPRSGRLEAKDGYKVVVEITAWPDKRRGPEGKVIEVLGPSNAPGMDIISLCRRYDLPGDFPQDVEEEAQRIPAEISPGEIKGRRDLRDWTIVTIDGEDAKDLDDAVSIEVLPNGNFRLGVHIADVSYYVQEDSALDKEARERGNSFYLPGTVIPMLPERLSNGICSLNPRVDRLTISVVMDIDGKGNVKKYEIFPSVIRTCERMTYTAVRRILVDQDPEIVRRYHYLVDTFRSMERLALILRSRRLKRGAIDFNLPEAKVELNEEGRPVNLYRVERTIAEQIIEEFMLVTNETVAAHFYNLGVPFLYRVHEKPDAEKLAGLQELLNTLGYKIPGFPKVRPWSLQKVLEQVQGKKEERLVNAVMLRTMQQARYASERLEHFGLAAEYYTHFTSPIRRYSDLVVHRIIREIWRDGMLRDKREQYLKGILSRIAQHCSDQERLAMEAEREAMDIKKAIFMQDKIGEEFSGIISGVTAFGMFVELENTVEGMVTLTNLTDDYYDYDDKHYCLVGQRTGRVFRLGDEVRVRVLRVSVDDRQIELGLAQHSVDNKGFKRSF
ncbi:MAG: ribonuclease R [Peptococcaceae bacterium]|nr:ribonuclease R [Peptococcaceae bacterium]